MSKNSGPWAKETIFKDKDGRTVIEFEIIEGPGKGEKKYKGQIMLNIKVSNDPRVPTRQQLFEFDFPEDKTFNWVRKNFDATADSAIESFRKAQEKQAIENSKKIVTPPAGNMPLFGPGGKPMKM